VRVRGLQLPSWRGSAPRVVPAAGESLACAFGWHVHEAQAAWARNADVKASILLALEGGILCAAISGFGGDGLLGQLGGQQWPVTSVIEICALVLAIVAAGIAIFPRLGKEDDEISGHRHVIYFGDLRRWRAPELNSHIASLTAAEQLEVISQQLTEMSRANWAKHRWVQASLLLSFVAMLAVGLSIAGTM
jgi:hypothetical protein